MNVSEGLSVYGVYLTVDIVLWLLCYVERLRGQNKFKP